MQIPTLSPSFALSSVRRELRYTLVRIRPLPWATAQVLVFDALLNSCDNLIAQEQTLRDDLEDAEAQLDQVDGELDALVLSLDKFIRASMAAGARDLLLKAMFQGQSPSRFVRPQLGPELDQVRTWPALLAGAKLAKLVAMGTEVAALLVRIDAAVAAHAKASSDMAAFALNVHGPFVAKVNGERQSLAGEAGKQSRLDGSGGEAGLFRRLSKSRAKPVVTLSAIDGLIKEAEAQVAVLKTQKAELEADAKAEAAALAERKQKEAELVELRKLEAETKEKAKSLQNELGLH